MIAEPRISTAVMVCVHLFHVFMMENLAELLQLLIIEVQTSKITLLKWKPLMEPVVIAYNCHPMNNIYMVFLKLLFVWLIAMLALSLPKLKETSVN